MRALWVPLLIPVLILSVYLGWSWYQVKYVMDELTASVSSFATLTYETIPIAFKGEYSVKGVEFDLFDSGVVTRVETIKLTTNDWQQLLLQGTPWQNGRLPDDATLSFENVQFDSRVRTENPLVAIMLEQPVMHGCLKKDGQPVVLRDLELGMMRSDITAEYRFNPESQIVNASLNANTRGIGSVGIGADFDINDKVISRDRLELHPPQLMSINIEALDQGYNETLISHCTQASQITTEAFIQKNLATLNAQLASVGLQTPSEFVRIYPQLFDAGASVKLAIEFKHPLPMEGSALMPDVSFLDLIEVRAAVNGKRLDIGDSLKELSSSVVESRAAMSGVDVINNNGFISSDRDFGKELDSQESEKVGGVLLPATPTKVIPKQSAVTSTTVVSKQESLPVKPAKPELSFTAVSIKDINRSAVGKVVKVETVNGRSVEGEVIGVLNNRMLIRQQIGTGDAEIPLLFKHVRRVQLKQ